jgi:hypothetical protein
MDSPASEYVLHIRLQRVGILWQASFIGRWPGVAVIAKTRLQALYGLIEYETAHG